MHRENNKYYFTSESVTEGHPDKVCDQISDGVLDAVLKDDPAGRVACESFITRGMVVVGGEITTKTFVDVDALARQVIDEIGYNHPKYGFVAETCGVMNCIGRQSPDISQGVDTGGAGDQGIMFGYACRETPELMPLPIMLAHKLCRKLSDVRRANGLKYLGPDGKSQVTVEYLDGRALRVDTVVVSTQHTPEILDRSGKQITDKARAEITEAVIKPVLGKRLMDKNTKVLINPTGKFVVGGPVSDTGVTGRKIIVDTYGGRAPHGGGAFSGKDPTKVDRSACYMARYIAKNVVAAGLAEQVTVQLAYAIGVAEPVGVYFDTHGTGQVEERRIEAAVRRHFPLTPRGIIETLKLRRPIFRATAAFGHFGREEKGFEWEKTDKAETLREELLGKSAKSGRKVLTAA
jgi:S-adenosylmethionine synthetase